MVLKYNIILVLVDNEIKWRKGHYEQNDDAMWKEAKQKTGCNDENDVWSWKQNFKERVWAVLMAMPNRKSLLRILIKHDQTLKF